MATVFQKLNLKDQTEILILNAPENFEPEIASLNGVRVLRSLGKAKTVSFALAFVTRQAEVDKLVAGICPKLEGDAILWFAYPKGTSKKYKCDFNRDTGWQGLGEFGYEGVRMVAIDEDWSALRFRHASFVKTIQRAPSRAPSAEGKQRAAARSR